ncbi:unnamed protein product [Durusdinium trenchii]|uniref:Ferredoxin n=2 Tax=Durusdinium trenchii TaxID=1381693 RepID=A0ABP0L5T5_9DINO
MVLSEFGSSLFYPESTMARLCKVLLLFGTVSDVYQRRLWTGVSRRVFTRENKVTLRRYKVTLQSDEESVSFECAADEYVLAQAEEQGIEMPSLCRYGNCAACIGKLLSGHMDQSEQVYLTEEELEEGYCITCVGYPASDVTIKTGCRDEVIESKCCFSTPLCAWCPYQGMEGERPQKSGRPGVG